jgi:hypothetical protein
MTTHESKKEKGSFWAWVGSIFLWFVTPTGASALWEKWLAARENETNEKEEQEEALKESKTKDS